MKENMDSMMAILAGIPSRVIPNKGDYYADDGLLRCGVCGQRREIMIVIFGKEKTVPCLCECESRREQEMRERMQMEEQMLYISRLRTTGLQDRLLRKCRLEMADDTREVSIASDYVRNWSRWATENTGLLFWGPVGTGKSFIAACIANALIETGTPVLMTNFPKILNSMGSVFSEERKNYIASFQNYPLLIIDDLGVERSTEFTQEMVFQLIDERYKSELPLIVTTNKTWDEIKHPKNVGDARIFSRLREMCVPVFVGGDDRRETKAEMTIKKMKETFK